MPNDHPKTTEEALVEYVAIAIWGDDADDPWRSQNEPTQETYRIEARAAIKAIREWDAQHGRQTGDDRPIIGRAR